MEINLEQLKFLSYYIKNNVRYCSILKHDEEIGNNIIVDYKIEKIQTTFQLIL